MLMYMVIISACYSCMYTKHSHANINVYKLYFVKISEVNKLMKITQHIGNIEYTKLFLHSIATARGWFEVVISSHATFTLHNVMCARAHTHTLGHSCHTMHLLVLAIKIMAFT